jgi:hypothetical protein
MESGGAMNGNGIKSAEFRGLMLGRTEDMIKRLDKIEEKVDCNIKDIVTLKIKASMWGFIAGSVPALVTALILLLR